MATWGHDGPPEEAYGRVTNSERFRPLHGIANDLLDRLEREFDVSRTDAPGLDHEIAVGGEQATRLTPASLDAGPLVLARTEFPGLVLRLGHWCVASVPPCGCDACDETLDTSQRQLESLVSHLTLGRLAEWIDLPLFGSAWYHLVMPGSSQESRIARTDARRMINRAEARHFAYAPWPRR